MIIKPKIRGFICTTAHPEGCRQNVKSQIEYVKSQPKGSNKNKKVLIIGASMGFGLASRITAAYSNNADTIGVVFEKKGEGNKTSTSGWYNTAAFEEFAHADGLYAKTINGDAFSQEIKQQTLDLIKKDLGKIDMLIYSLAAPRRTDKDGEVYNSVIKTIGNSFTDKTIDLKTRKVSEVTIEPANEKEIHDTIKVMGGEDWKDWISFLKANDAIEDDAITLAYSYIGPEITHPMYLKGTIGKAKEHLYNTSKEISEEFNIKSYISVNKALVTQSSAAIPVVPLYISILYKIMKKENIHEGCIEQMCRLFNEKLNGENIITDSQNQIRLDDWEMKEDIQSQVKEIWNKINDENIDEYSDVEGYWNDFYNIFGFGFENIDYEKDVDIDLNINSINN